MIRHLICLTVSLTCGCRMAKVPVAAPAPKPSAGAFIDLEPGWRLRLITPLIAGGGFRVKSAAAQEQGNTITMRVAQDFLGFETAYYDVLEGLKVQFATAEVTRDGKTVPQPKPVQPLFAGVE